MNYLAHLFLSGNTDKVMVGNFIGDHVKGKKYNSYPTEIVKGILLHRQIDSFTDKHAKTKEAKTFFRNEFGLYSGIIVDFLYDHFLAKNWNNYSDETLRTFSKRAHAILLSNFRYLPVRVKSFLPFLIQNKRLESYASVDGIVEALRIMSNYSSMPPKSEAAKTIFQDNYQIFEEIFHCFMQDIIEFVGSEHGIEIKKPESTSRL